MYCIINRNGQKWNKFCGFNLKSLVTFDPLGVERGYEENLQKRI